MTTRTVRLDDRAQTTLEDLMRATGETASEILRRGLAALEAARREGARRETAYEIYRTLDLGPGGDAVAPAGRSREGARAAIRRKHGR